MARSFAMRVYAATYWLLAALFLYILAVLILPMLATSPEVGAFLPIVGLFFGLFVLGAAAATFWRSAPVRGWFWLVGMIPPVLFLLLNAPFVPFALTHPTDFAFTAILPLVVGSIVLVVAGVAGFRQARAGAAAPATSLRWRWATAIVAGATLGAFATSYVASTGGGAGGATLAALPTTSASLVAQNTRFLTTSYTMASSDVLGLFVANKDSFAHSFDIDALDVHVNVPANSTVAIAVKPTGPGSLAFYCAIPGHEEAGMAGTITVQ